MVGMSRFMDKSYNGVAITSRYPIKDVICGLPGDDSDEQARYIEASRNCPCCQYDICLRQSGTRPKFDYKLRWMERLNQRAAALLASEQPIIFGGDFNVIPDDLDYDPLGWEEMLSPIRKHERHFARLPTPVIVTRCAPATRMKLSIPIGIIRQAHGNAIMVSGLII